MNRTRRSTQQQTTRFAGEYLAQLEAFAAVGPIPRVRALHLPPPIPEGDRNANKGEFCALELDDGSLGLSYVLLDDTLEKMRSAAEDFHLAGTDALALARRYVDGRGIDKTFGFAAANALTRCLFDRAGFVPDISADSIGGIDPRPADHIGMIGLFKPLLGRILGSGARLTVVELNADLAGAQEGYVVTLDTDALGDCNKVVSTSTLLLNDTLDRMLACCRNARWFAMVGPSAGCLPDALFGRGVTLLGGSWVTDRAGFVNALKRGESTSACARKFALTRDDYPGTPALLKRLQS
ncbi:MAG TPA: DUF364 domain-containing protein [Rhodocyclaceae bacterium]|nr:DUF364 domain-containing protein [Rhodocyclaceae bacterium]